MNAEDDIFQAIIALKTDVGELKTNIGILQNDVDWIKTTMQKLSERQQNCVACANSEYLRTQADTNRKDIKELQDNKNQVIGAAVMISGMVSFLIAIVGLWISYVKTP